jgi:hypothetical protein
MTPPVSDLVLGARRRRLGEESRHVAAKAHHAIVAPVALMGVPVARSAVGLALVLTIWLTTMFAI